MQKILSSYLLRNRNCPLPGMGSLQIFNEDSRFMQPENILTPPGESIALVQQQLPAEDIIEFIAFKTNSSYAKAEKRLEKFVKKLRKLQKGEELYFPFAGTFRGGSFKTEFFPDKFENVFFQPVAAVPASRQTHHNVLVGDKEVLRSATVEELDEEESPARKWYLAALLILFASLAVIAWLWLSSGKFPIGNTNHIVPATEKPTYTTAP